MLEISDLHVSTAKKEILKGVSLKIKPGQTHALMGPNGSGKSSLSMALMGHPQYLVTSGKIILDGEDITEFSVDKRAKAGLFLTMQYPVAVPGVSISNFMRSAYKNLKDPGVKALEIQTRVREEMENLKLDEKFLARSVNEGFSGGEKKKLETLQLSILRPKYAVLDETDSGLDVDALKIIANRIVAYSRQFPKQRQFSSSRKRRDLRIASGQARLTERPGILLITHYQRILRYIQPDFVHILVDGRIVKSGDKKLAEEIEERGYGGISELKT